MLEESAFNDRWPVREHHKKSTRVTYIDTIINHAYQSYS